MKPGHKVTEPYTQTGRKTGRRYGELTSIIRAKAATAKQFSWRDFCPPFQRAVIKPRLSAMKTKGELRQVRPASSAGRAAQPALFTKAKP